MRPQTGSETHCKPLVQERGVTELGEQSPQGSLGKAHRACGKEGAIRSFFRHEREPTGENHMRAGKHSPFIRKGAFQSWYR